MNNYTAIQIANYIIWLVNNRLQKKNLTPLKLQKILYYVQATYLARTGGNSLFIDPIQKWQYGPVVPSVYFEFKDYGVSHISEPKNNFNFSFNTEGELSFSFSAFNPQIILNDHFSANLIDNVVTVLIDRDPFDLVNQTHNEILWSRDRYRILSGERGIEYSNEELTKFFQANPIF